MWDYKPSLLNFLQFDCTKNMKREKEADKYFTNKLFIFDHEPGKSIRLSASPLIKNYLFAPIHLLVNSRKNKIIGN